MVSKTLPHWRFQGLLTLFPKFFSTFLHSTCLLSVSGKYLALGEIHLPICTVLSNSTTLQAVTWIVDHPICNTGLSPSLALFSNRLSTKRSPSVQLIHYILEMMFTTTQFSIELILFHSQLLKRYDSATRPHADVRFATRCSEKTVHRSPPLLFSLPRVIATNTSSSDSASCRSRNLDTAFRSLTTTLSPPLRGQCSWPAPSFPRRRLSRTRSIPGSSAPFGFEAEPGRRQRPEPVFRSTLQHSEFFPDLHSPPGLLSKTLRIKAFDRFQTRKLVSPDVRLSLAPRRFLLRFGCGSVLETRSVCRLLQRNHDVRTLGTGPSFPRRDGGHDHLPFLTRHARPARRAAVTRGEPRIRPSALTPVPVRSHLRGFARPRYQSRRITPLRPTFAGAGRVQ